MRNEAVLHATRIAVAWSLWLMLLLISTATSPANASEDIVVGRTYDSKRPDLALITRVQGAFFDDINTRGGVRGHTVRFVALDDKGDAAVAQSNIRALDEREKAVLLFNINFVAPNPAPDIAQVFGRDRTLPEASDSNAVIVGFYPTYFLEGKLIGEYVGETSKSSRVAIALGTGAGFEGFAAGIRAGLGLDADRRILKTIVLGGAGSGLAESVRSLKAAGATVLVVGAEPRLTVQIMGAVSAAGWKPERIMDRDSARSMREQSAGARSTADGAVSVRYLKDPNDPLWATFKPYRWAEFPRWTDDRGAQAYNAFIRHHVSDVDPKSEVVEYAYTAAQLVVYLLEQCRDQLTRQEASKRSMRLAWTSVPLLSPGIRIYTYPGHPTPITQGQPIRFDGMEWSEFGDVLDAED